ncbi:MAG: hypothetical protein NUW37_11830 [Planctomycetes bacterium]|nr:hypothetical protein [Planctomycetota bacterium]
MEKEYDFSSSKRGKFSRPKEQIKIKFYLDSDVSSFFAKKALESGADFTRIVNDILRREMDADGIAK